MLAVLSGVPLAITAIFVIPTFREMFADLGAELPALTQLVFSPGVVLVAAVVPLVLVGLVALRLGSRSLRFGLLVVAVCWGLSVEALVIIACYLPIFQLADLVSQG